MEKKVLVGACILTTTCLVVLTAAVMGTSSKIDFNVTYSGATEHTVVMNKDTIVTRQCYREDGASISSYVFFQLENQGNHTAFISSTYFLYTIGGNHLYETEAFDSTGKGVSFAVDICGLCGNNYYFDSAKTQKINYPGIANITQIEFTLADENTAPVDESRITDYYRSTLEHDVDDPNTYRITNIPSNSNSYYAISFTTKEDNLNQKLVIDQIKVSYIC